MFVKLQTLAILCSLSLLQGCNGEPWNDPYPQFNNRDNTLYSAFTERPKHLDPALSYESTEAIFTYSIYEPPLQYHYLKRPYELVPLTTQGMPQVRYFNKADKEVNQSDGEIAYSLYQITIQPGIYYQAHPAFAKDPNTGAFIYDALTQNDVKNKHTLADFPKTGTRELEALDYIYQIKRLADPTLNSPIYGFMEDYIVGFKAFSENLHKIYQSNTGNYVDLRNYDLAGVKLIDKYTYEIKIQGKYPQFLNWLAMPFFAPIPWEAIKFYSQPLLVKKNISLDWYPVGTGPFILSVNNPNFQMVLEKNPNFHGEIFPQSVEKEDIENGLKNFSGLRVPFLDKIVFVLEKESIPYWNKFLQGYYDQSAVTSTNFDQALTTSSPGNLELSNELKEKNIHLSTAVQPTIFYWGFNMLDERVGGYSESKKKLRQALAIALDMEEYINIFLNGSGIAAQSPLPPGIFGYRADLNGMNPIVYNIDQTKNLFERKSITEAKKLLSEAGYPDGIDPKTKQPLILYFDTVVAGNPDSAPQLAWIRKQFEKLGIDLVIRGTQYNRFQDKMANGDFQIFSWGWNADYPDPENFLFLLFSQNGRLKFGGENVCNYENPVLDKLFEKMKNMENSPLREQIINQMIDILREDAPWIGGYHPIQYSLRQAWVGAIKPNPISRNTLKYVLIDPSLREKNQALWNRPVIYPLMIGLLVLIILCIPAFISYWIRNHKVQPLKNAKPLMD